MDERFTRAREILGLRRLPIKVGFLGYSFTSHVMEVSINGHAITAGISAGQQLPHTLELLYTFLHQLME